ncbi:hypothetical protein RBSH_05714 [Rhodopirellula baltica SH28]|uniref:Uncharacterized protein n=1 Tax=Rhodopirellula baltica SH28 TaxID=993517 RepID=K5D941_RHOBT|nr:hypothetical protein RBSH_05714 [Rhodopirellula baltica SH28]
MGTLMLSALRPPVRMQSASHLVRAISFGGDYAAHHRATQRGVFNHPPFLD